jgi:cytochrome c oxidase subunit IV
MSERATFVLIYVICLVLLAATITTAQFQLGAWNPILNMSISLAKTSLIVWFFMHLRRAATLIRLAAFAGFFWLLIMFGLSLGDYLTREPPPELAAGAQP